jgi:hypothetical protein
MRRRTSKKRSLIKKYTAFAPKTLNATKKFGKTVKTKVRYFFRNTIQGIKKTTKMLDKKTSKAIYSLTRRRSRK